MHRFALKRLTPIALSLLLLAACGTQVVNPVTGRSERSVMDEATEITEGKKAHQQVLAEYGVLANPRLQAYVNDVGQKLANWKRLREKRAQMRTAPEAVRFDRMQPIIKE